MSKNSEEPGGRPPRHNGRKSIGPVSDPEQYVSQYWWKRIFNSLYLKTDSDVVNDQDITKKEIDLFLRILGLSSDDKILDLCCGQGRHSIELFKRGFENVEGIDRSHYLIRKAKESARKENLFIKFREGDARKIPYLSDSFDAVLVLGNSFGYFDSMEDDLRVLKEIFRVLKPNGKLLMDVADGDYLRKNFQPRSWEWMDKNHFVCRERALSKDSEKLISREVITNISRGVLADQFYSERLYNLDAISGLFEKAGFSNYGSYGGLSTESKRNQDLGMMEHRLIITAQPNKSWTYDDSNYSEEWNVAVIMGDPGNDPDKKDLVKPNGLYSEEDMHTRDELKKALSKLEGYKFAYFEDHDALMDSLKKNKYNIDYIFNLCDEGFNNNPNYELHITALLDILGIPYTGAGPQCLAHCYDKSLVRGIAREMNIPVPDAFLISPEDTEINFNNVNFPVIVKPNFGDSSFGITQRSVVNNAEELLDVVSEIRSKFGYNKPMLVEEFLTGKDLTIGMIGNNGNIKILPIGEEDYSMLPENLPKICGYEAKWDMNSPYWNSLKTIKAELSEEQKDIIISSSLKLYKRLELKDYGRFDWRIDRNGSPKLLEANPNPGWCWDGHLAKMSNLIDMDYSQMLALILKSAEKRLNLKLKEQLAVIRAIHARDYS